LFKEIGLIPNYGKIEIHETGSEEAHPKNNVVVFISCRAQERSD